MAARPRSHNIKVPNLYEKLDKRSGKVYYQYRDPRSGKFHGLGTERKRALAVAAELNDKISQQLLTHFHHILDDNEEKVKRSGISVMKWCQRYITLMGQRYKEGEISVYTKTNRTTDANILASRCGTVGIAELDTKTLALIIDEYIAQGKRGMARRLRHTWCDIYKEAQHDGEVPSGFNPALAVRNVKFSTQRRRLTKEAWALIIKQAEAMKTPELAHAMKIALTTGLRRSDIHQLRFDDIYDDHLHVSLSKSKGKTKLAFPLSLKSPLLSESLGDIVQACRQTKVRSNYLIHKVAYTGKNKPGSQLHLHYLTAGFARIRDKVDIIWDGPPPTFHEIRSLAERSYKEIGLNTQILLGHKSQSMTDIYHDNRGAEYVRIVFENAKGE